MSNTEVFRLLQHALRDACAMFCRVEEIPKALFEGKWREVEAIDEGHARGELDDAGWHRAMARLIVPAYLGADTIRGGSGHSGSDDDWEWSRGLVAEAIDRDGSFLDVGCANGLLMQSVERWAAGAKHTVTAYGLDIAPELVEVARKRLPHHAHRIFTGNALGWKPPMRFDFVRAGLEYVPQTRRREFVAWLLDELVAPGGRLILGKYNEAIEQRALEARLIDWGFTPAGRAERAHRSSVRVAYRNIWIDAPQMSFGDLGFRSLRPADLTRLYGWLCEPHVASWWRDGLDLAGVHAKFGPRIAGAEPCFVYVIEFRGEPCGIIQWYRWRSYAEHAAQLGADLTAAGVDLLIGVPELLDRGLGTDVLRAFVDHVVFADPEISACFADPEAVNARSLRAFEKARFAQWRTVMLPGESTPRRVMRRPKLRRTVRSTR
jgi:RimJ/RimL family protein N-acetyltransferase